jgi:preprotein translocase subunit SecD
MKEELRSGKTIAAAIRAGEDRAWPSIRDSNTSTLITCAVLYFFGQQFGATIIMGFALVLGIGVMVSLFSAIVVTRLFLEILLGQSWAHSARLFGMEITSSQIGGATTRRPASATSSPRG